MKEIAKFGYVMIVALIISSLFNYMYQVVMGIMLPKSGFGVLGVSLSILYIASVLTQSTFSWSGTRRLSINLKAKTFRTTLLGNLALALIASTVLVVLSFNSAYLIPNAIVAVLIILSAVGSSYQSLLRAVKKFYHLAVANVLSSILKLVLAVILVMLGFQAVGALTALMLAGMATILFLYYSARDIKLQNSEGFEFEMLYETFFVSFVFLGVTFIVNSSIIFERIISSSDIAAGIYNASLTIARGSFFITSALVAVLFPYISSKSKESEEYAFQLVKYTVLFVFPICLSMAVNPKAWLTLFFGLKYIQGTSILRNLSLGIGLITIAYVLASNMVAFERAKVPSTILFFACIIQSLLATKPALSVVISSAFATAALTYYYSRSFYFKLTCEYIIKIIISYAILIACINLARLNDGRLIALMCIIFPFIIYFVALTVLGLFDEKDVEILLSPLPNSIVQLTKATVAKLNRR